MARVIASKAMALAAIMGELRSSTYLTADGSTHICHAATTQPQKYKKYTNCGNPGAANTIVRDVIVGIRLSHLGLLRRFLMSQCFRGTPWLVNPVICASNAPPDGGQRILQKDVSIYPRELWVPIRPLLNA
jgi:hypothetical protein